ncbi:MAG: hypothetical protein HYS04_16430 [Acidobacteria bacterium]|nr:hypothetical protein [Acidobacteriota bacterium]
MNEFERELRAALAPEDPPETLAGGILQRIGESSRKPAPLSGQRVFRWAAVAVMACLMLALSADLWRRRQADKAREQLLQAVRITSEKIEYAFHKAAEITEGRNQ